MTPSEVCGRSIRDLEAIATQLMSAVTQNPMKEQVGLATRDLMEARQLMQQPEIEWSRARLMIVQTTIELARTRLHGVSHALAKYGPDAELFG